MKMLNSKASKTLAASAVVAVAGGSTAAWADFDPYCNAAAYTAASNMYYSVYNQVMQQCTAGGGTNCEQSAIYFASAAAQQTGASTYASCMAAN